MMERPFTSLRLLRSRKRRLPKNRRKIVPNGNAEWAAWSSRLILRHQQFPLPPTHWLRKKKSSYILQRTLFFAVMRPIQHALTRQNLLHLRISRLAINSAPGARAPKARAYFNASEIVSGSFRNIAGTVTSSDASNNIL